MSAALCTIRCPDPGHGLLDSRLLIERRTRFTAPAARGSYCFTKKSSTFCVVPSSAIGTAWRNESPKSVRFLLIVLMISSGSMVIVSFTAYSPDLNSSFMVISFRYSRREGVGTDATLLEMATHPIAERYEPWGASSTRDS